MKYIQKIILHFFALILLLSPLVDYAQATAVQLEWAKRMGGNDYDVGSSIAVDADGNVYTTGGFRGTSDFDPGPSEYNFTTFGSDIDIFITKLDTDGNLVWAKQMGGTGFQTGTSIAIDVSGNVYITGLFEDSTDFNPDSMGVYTLTSAGDWDAVIVKLDANGNFVWAKQITGIDEEAYYSIDIDAAENIYTTGYFRGTTDFDPGPDTFLLTSIGDWDAFVSKLDTDGNFEWATPINGNYYDYGQSIAFDVSGNIYVTGSFMGSANFGGVVTLASVGAYDIFVSKLDSNGNFLWAKKMGGSGEDNGISVVTDASGNIYITGRFWRTVDFDPGPDEFALTSIGDWEWDIFVSKLDSNGKFVWAKQMGGPGEDGGYSIAIDASGDLYTTGYFYGTADFNPGPDIFSFTSFGNSDIFITKLDSDGNFVWAQRMGGAKESSAWSLVVDTFGNNYITGAFAAMSDFDPSPDVFNLASAGSIDVFVAKFGQITTGVNAPQFFDTFVTYPNPASNYFTLHLEGQPREGVLVELFNSIGQTIFHEQLDFQSGIVYKDYLCHNIPAGVYLLRVSSSQGNSFGRVIID